MEAEGQSHGLFLDTSVIIANLKKSDPHHLRAQLLFQRIENEEYAPVVISEFIYAESVTVAGIKLNQDLAIKIGRELLDPGNEMVQASSIFEKSCDLFASQKIYQLSFIDCSILAAMEEVGVKTLATYDLAIARFVKERGLDIEIVG